MEVSIPLSKRILKEISDGYKSELFGFFYDDNNKFEEPYSGYIRFTIRNGPYQGQTHVLRIKFIWARGEKVFPKDPVLIEFLTPIYHPNVGNKGAICVDVFRDHAWSPMYGIETIFSSILELLETPNNSSPMNGSAAADNRKYASTPHILRELCYKYYVENIKNSGFYSIMMDDTLFNKKT